MLGQIGDARAVEPLCCVLGDKNQTMRWQAAEALGRIGDVRAVDLLCRALGDGEVSVRQEGATALGRIGDERAVEPLCLALCNEDRRVRIQAAGALGRIGRREGLPALKARLRIGFQGSEFHPDVRAALRVAIQQIEELTPGADRLPRAAEAEFPSLAARPRMADEHLEPHGKARPG